MATIARSLRMAKPAASAFMPKFAASARPAFRTFSTTRLSLARRYTVDHEWIDLSADQKSAVVGISAYAAEHLGDVVYVELPQNTGDWVDQGDAFAAVESVKSASDINAPVKCKVTEVNDSLEEKASTINKVPEDDSNGGGWIAKVEVGEEGAKQFEELMDSTAYEKFCVEAGEE